MTPIAAVDVRSAPVLHFKEIGSTNDEALSRARSGETQPLWLRADRQAVGRGRQGRLWTSPEGNLYTSLLMPVDSDARHLPQMAHVAVVALVDAIRAIVDLGDLRIKWPNDLLVGEAKVAGILVEATTTADRRQACVAGWGVNCRFHPEGLAYVTTDLSVAAGRTIEPDMLFAALVPAMAEALVLWNGGSGFAAIRARWLDHALPLDTPLTVRSGARQMTGRFRGMDTAGRLLLIAPDGPLTIEAGDVFLSDRSAAAIG